MVMRYLLLLIVGAVFHVGNPRVSRAADQSVDYLTQIKPLLATKCYSCHGVLKQEAGLRLETLTLMTRGGDSGPALVAHEAANSLILERVTADEDSRMPPAEDGAALKPTEIELLQRWIEQGAIAPEEDIPLAPSEHWAFLRVEAPPIPPSNEYSNPIDILLAAKRRQQGLQVQSQADRSLLIRRLYLDLIGLPPTVEQLHDDRSWEEIVDELLASPHHGERWGRHWMDIWRYSDWYGLGAQLRNSQKHMWRWRDWIVSSLNSDKGYDRMLQEMLAGDELAPEDLDAVAGTGFLARNYYLFNRTTWLDSTIEHTGKAFLGLTLNCAKCHDHKYDPVSQVDYYSFRAIFEPHQVRLDPVPGVTDFEQDGLPRVFDDHPEAKTFLHIRGNPKDPDPDTVIQPGVPELFASFQPEITAVDLPPTAYAPGTRDYVQQDHLHAAAAAIQQAKDELAAAKQTVTKLAAQSDHADAAAAAAEFEFADDFEAADPATWEIVGEGWEYANSSLQQTRATRDIEYLRLRRPLPRDFDLTCRYTTTGGTTYKSVTFRFDESADRSYANFVYSSAHAPGPKIQVAYSRDGSTAYPADGMAARPVRVGEQIELRFAVRDRLVNVWHNGDFVIAYLLPDRHPQGHLSLSGFDATVAFHSISIRSLPADLELADAKNAAAPSPESAALAVEIAEAKLRAEELRLEALRAVIEADRAQYTQPESAAAATFARQAATLQAETALATAALELLQAGSDGKKAAAAKARAKTARQTLADIEQGKYSYTSLRASRKALESPAHKEPDYPPTYSSVSTGRRLALARWMTDRNNPLTARVAVNHVWTRHFGEPLVESMFDFGLRAKKPLHADVLDYLAAEFMQSGWSFKHLHRLIATSETYRLSSSATDTQTHEKDPTNRFYWRMNVRRMEAQVVRDSLLLLSGELDRTLGGPSIDVNKRSNRRSLYFKHSRDEHDKFLTMFDDADLLQCYRRSESIVPQQALALANSELSMTMARTIAAHITDALPGGGNNEFIDRAFETVLCRSATVAEHEACRQFCGELQDLLKQQVSEADMESRIRTRLIHSLLNHNDFISIR